MDAVTERRRQQIPAKVRRRVLERDSYQCRRCGRPWALEMHHRKARSLGGPNVPANLLTLCCFCHKEWTKTWMSRTDEPDFAAFMKAIPQWFVRAYASALDQHPDRVPDLRVVTGAMYPLPDWMWLCLAALAEVEIDPRCRLDRTVRLAS